MIGTIIWNVIFASIGAMITFLIALSTNTIDTAGLRSGIVFAVFYVSMFIIRGALAIVFQSSSIHEEAAEDEIAEDTLKPKANGEEQSQEDLSEEQAKQTSDMVRALLNEDS